eukprot:gb/GFBE01028753.1/.p1 GENE.gb/GFBE01028753.1/~~gb/GFBE01028753.1/.p1  ORF type:complete len:289 (+),score=57.95 gb/GFBE01028753.1/:1-867(+)
MARAMAMNTPFLAAPGQDFMAAGHQGQALASGFEIWQGGAGPSAPSPGQFAINGSDFSQVLELTLQPGQTVTAEPGTMLYMTPGMMLDADVGSMEQGLKRCCCAGESFFRLHLKNTTNAEQKVGLTPKFPAKIVPVDLSLHSGMIVNRGAFLAALGTDWKVDLKMARSVGVGLCAGQGLFMNTLHGQGMAFLNAGGTVMTRELRDGEEMIVDPHSILAFQHTVRLDIKRTGGMMVCCCAGQGLFNASLTGPGFIMVHSMALSKLRAAVATPGANGGGNNNGANSGGDS